MLIQLNELQVAQALEKFVQDYIYSGEDAPAKLVSITRVNKTKKATAVVRVGNDE